MKRREFSQVAATAALASGWLPAVALAQGKKPEAGADYQVLDPRAPVDAPASKIEIVEFFWYSCPHCHAFEPTLDAWTKKLPKDVVFRRAPVAFRDDFVPQQRLYFALDAMGLVDKLHAKVFAAIHVEKQNLASSDAIVDWVAKQGVEKAKFLEQYNSFTVATKATRSKQLQNAYKVEGVPAMGVAGRYYSDGSMAGNMERVLQIVDTLTASIRSGR